MVDHNIDDTRSACADEAADEVVGCGCGGRRLWVEVDDEGTENIKSAIYTES